MDLRVIAVDLYLGNKVISDVAERVKYLKEIRERAQAGIMKAQEHQLKYYNSKRVVKIFQVGDYVWISNQNWSRIRPSKKFDQLQAGPRRVIKRIGKNTY